MGADNRVAIPNAAPKVTTRNPSMIFVFTVPLQAAVAAMGTDSKRKSACKTLKKPILYATI
jgi:hypothetical protein